MCAPMRYTASKASVNRTRFRKSGMRNMFWSASTNRFISLTRDSSLRYDLKRAASFRNLVLGRGAEGLRVNRELVLQFAVAQNFYRIRGAAHKTVRAQQFRCHRFARGEDIQLFHVDDGISHAKRIMKPALRHAAVQRHLAAFKTAPARIATTRLLALVAGTGSLAQFRAHAAPHTHLAVARAARRPQIREARDGLRRLGLFCGFAAAAGFFRCHPFTPPLPRGAALYESCRGSPGYRCARLPDASGAIPARGWFPASRRCS